MVAPSNGSVHVAYTVIDGVTGNVELRYNKSDDCGQTWLPSEMNFGLVVQSEFDLIALDTGEVYLFWSEGGFEILMAKSADGGDTFAPPVLVNSNLSGFNRNPLACVVGGVIFVAFAAPDGPSAWFTTFVTASDDGGATFVPEIQMIPDMPSGGAFEHTLDCYESVTGTAGVYAVVMAGEDEVGVDFGNVALELVPEDGGLTWGYWKTHTGTGETPANAPQDEVYTAAEGCTP